MPAAFTDFGIVDLDRKTPRSREHSSARNDARRSVHATVESMAGERPAIVGAGNGSAEFDSKRNDWRARFGAAPTTRAKESDRGND